MFQTPNSYQYHFVLNALRDKEIEAYAIYPVSQWYFNTRHGTREKKKAVGLDRVPRNTRLFDRLSSV